MTFTNFQDAPLTLTDNVKDHLKNSFAKVLWSLFSAEDEWLDSLVTGLKYEPDPQKDGLHIYTKFPNIERELPTIAISLRSIIGRRMTVNQYLGPAYVDTLENPDLSPGQKPVQGFFVTGLVQFDVLTTHDFVRDALIDKLVDFFIFRGDNAAKLDSKHELEQRYIRIDVDNFALAGDQEFPADEGTGDMIFTDGVAVSFDAELYQLSYDRVPLERIDPIDIQSRS